MKTNLSKIYSTNKDVEKNGKWFDIAEGVSFKMKRFGGANSLKISEVKARYFKPYARQLERNTLDKEIQQELFIKVFVDTCMCDWKGLEDEQGKIEYSRDNAIELFKETPDLFDEVLELSMAMGEFKEGNEDLGKS